MRVAAGTLDRRMYGLPVFPPLDERELIGNYRKWSASPAGEADRRAVYIVTRRSFRFPALGAFDLPENVASCGQRDCTVVPNQALTLLNNRSVRDQAGAFADRLLRETDRRPEAVAERAWLIAYGRPITAGERDDAVAFLRAREKEARAPTRAGGGHGAVRRAVQHQRVHLPPVREPAWRSPLLTRRHWLARTGLGFGAWALLDLLERDRAAAGQPARGPQAALPGQGEGRSSS